MEGANRGGDLLCADDIAVQVLGTFYDVVKGPQNLFIFGLCPICKEISVMNVRYYEYNMLYVTYEN
jgi:hypothetical protein